MTSIFRTTFPVGPLQCNCSILGDPDSKEAIVVDPGDEVDRILDVIETEGLKPVGIVHTHAHLDHVGATRALGEATGAPTYLHDGDEMVLASIAMQAGWLGMPPPKPITMSGALEDNQSFKFGPYELGVMHTPGHTPGSACFELVGHDLCFSGDTLFNGSIGRTDLPGGDFSQIEKSIRDRLYALNGAVEVVPGHGPGTSIDRERVSNPFVRPRT